MPLALAGVYAALPLFPSFIALTHVAYPGVSLISPPAALIVLGLVGLLAIYGGAMLLFYRNGPTQPLALPMLAFFGAALFSAIVGFDPAAGLLFVGIFGLGIVWHCSLVRFYDDPFVETAIWWAYVVSGGLAAAAAIAMVLTRSPASLYTIGHGRAIGTFILPGELAAYLVVFLPIAVALYRVAESRALRSVAAAAAVTGAAALLLTFSRAGWMGCAAAFGFLAAARARRLRYGAAAAAAAVALGAVAVFAVFNAHHNPSEDYTRISIWRAALSVIDRFPLTGVGPFDFARLYAVVRAPDADATAFHAHSLYLTFFAELGILGVAAFAWVAWRFSGALRARLAKADPAAAFVALAATAGLVGVAVQGLIDTMSIVIFGLWLPTMGLALAAAARRRQSDACADRR